VYYNALLPLWKIPSHAALELYGANLFILDMIRREVREMGNTKKVAAEIVEDEGQLRHGGGGIEETVRITGPKSRRTMQS
jgi:hypothetical protein